MMTEEGNGGCKNIGILEHKLRMVSQMFQYLADGGFIKAVSGFKHPDRFYLYDLWHIHYSR